MMTIHHASQQITDIQEEILTIGNMMTIVTIINYREDNNRDNYDYSGRYEDNYNHEEDNYNHEEDNYNHEEDNYNNRNHHNNDY